MDDTTETDEFVSGAEASQRFVEEAGVSEVPLIRSPDPGEIDLLYGLMNDNDTRQRVAKVRELNGSDEEALARIDSRRSDYYVLLEDMIIKRATEWIGDIDIQKFPSKASRLLMADRGLLFMQIMFATYGDTKEYEGVVCPACGASTDLTISIPDMIKITPLADANDPTVTVRLKNGRVALLHYPTGEDQLFVHQQKKNSNESERNTFMIQRTLDLVDGKAVANPAQFALGLSMPDRRKIIDALQKGPGVAFEEVEVPCTSCEVKMPLVFGWADLLQV